MKNILKILIPAVALGLGSCVDNFSNHKVAEYDDHKAIVWNFGKNTYLTILGETPHHPSSLNGLKNPYLRALNDLKTNRGFDKIFLNNLSEDDPLREYIPLDSLDKIYNHVLETGEDF